MKVTLLASYFLTTALGIGFHFHTSHPHVHEEQEEHHHYFVLHAHSQNLTQHDNDELPSITSKETEHQHAVSSISIVAVLHLFKTKLTTGNKIQTTACSVQKFSLRKNSFSFLQPPLEYSPPLPRGITFDFSGRSPPFV